MFFLALALAFEVPVESPVWKMPVEERIERRFDPAGKQARTLAARQARISSGATSLPEDEEQDVIVGRDTPELLLPFEIFGRLVRLGFAPNVEARDGFRTSLERARRDVGLPGDFWSRLEAATNRYRAKVGARKPQPFEIGQEAAPMDVESRSICSERAKALAAARREFGEESFNRFLYLGVAPGMFLVTVGNAPGPDRLLELEKGCE